MTSDERVWQESEEEVLERIWDRMHRDYQQAGYDYLGGEAAMSLREVLKRRVTDILQRTADVAAAIEEIADAMADEVEARAQDRLADLRTQLESGDKP